ncbi:hypothetical protein HPG69_009478 [Diceros bicornis minor]|uniref:Non-selective voltage-gated ion channel VDAC3 n=1 Tax=Diceros bicornis minor TaxID=77932 RepID=A0A7J7F3S9_DICBM|nr:hypothetical protein HPG69_009478 [Diceros bicornis minor]
MNTFTQKWNADIPSILGQKSLWRISWLKGWNRPLTLYLYQHTGNKSGKLKASYKPDCFSLGSWPPGYQMSFDTAKSKLSQSNFALGHKAAYFQLHIHVKEGTECGAGSNNTHFDITAKYKLACRTSLSAKVNNANLIGQGYTQTFDQESN